MANYKVYCDGAVNNVENRMAFSYLIFTDTKFIEYGYQYTDGDNPVHAEILAILTAAKAVLSLRLKDKDKVTFYVDSVSAINFVSEYLKGERKKTPNKDIQRMMCKMISLNEQVQVTLRKVKGHKVDITPNRWVDLLAKYALRSKSCTQ